MLGVPAQPAVLSPPAVVPAGGVNLAQVPERRIQLVRDLVVTGGWRRLLPAAAFQRAAIRWYCAELGTGCRVLKIRMKRLNDSFAACMYDSD
jgi:hypothetical protein